MSGLPPGPAGFTDGDAAIVYPKQLAARTSTLRSGRPIRASARSRQRCSCSRRWCRTPRICRRRRSRSSYPCLSHRCSSIRSRAAQEPAGSFLKGRFLIGVNVTHSLTPDQDLGSHWSVSPVIRNTPRRLGWGPSFGLSGYTGDIVAPIDGQEDDDWRDQDPPAHGRHLVLDRRRPSQDELQPRGRVRLLERQGHGRAASRDAASIDITDAWVVRPNVGFTYALTRRLAIIGFGRLRLHEPDDHRHRQPAGTGAQPRQRVVPQRLRQRHRRNRGVDLLASEPQPGGHVHPRAAVEAVGDIDLELEQRDAEVPPAADAVLEGRVSQLDAVFVRRARVAEERRGPSGRGAGVSGTAREAPATPWPRCRR